MSEPFKPALMSIARTAEYLGRSERYVWRLIALKEIEVVGNHRKRWVPTASSDAYVERLRKRAREAAPAQKSLSPSKASNASSAGVHHDV